MARYTVTLTVDGAREASVRKLVEKKFGRDVHVRVAKVETNQSRSDRFAECESKVSEAKEEVESLKGELQNWRDNLPENLQSGTKADELDEAISELENIGSELENIDFGNVTFPSMM